MIKHSHFLGLLFVVITSGTASAVAVTTTPRATSQYIKRDTYNYMYPYMNNKMRTDLNPGVTTAQSTNPMDVVVKTKPLDNSTSTRRVVARKNSASTARAATNTSIATTANSTTQTNRRVVARSGTNRNTNATISRGNRRTSPLTINNRTASTATTTATGESVSSARCMADYTECMNRYCERSNTEYNRCYCSAKLSQIDAKYQPAIQELITKILTIKGTNQWSDDEMNEYWISTVGKYTDGNNSWANLDDALNIDWAGLESTVRGQNAFTMGHEYCVQHLNNCYYMSSNLRDAYRSEISRDCNAYEQSLQKIKNAAENMLEYYND